MTVGLPGPAGRRSGPAGGRRLPRPAGRGTRRPRTLRTRLVVASLLLIAVISAVIGTVTTLALRSHLYEQLDGQLDEFAARATGFGKPPADRGPKGALQQQSDLAEFVTRGPQPSGSVIALVRGESGITDARVSELSPDSTDLSGMTSSVLDGTQRAALDSVPRDGRTHTVELPGLGEYRAEFRVSADGTRGYYLAVPTEEVSSTLGTLVIIEASVTAAALVAAGIAGTVMVGVATRPLRRVAATATRVSELPLHTGEVNLDERVPARECDPHTEVGQVGVALNRMLDHVHGALHARQESETRVRQFVADASHELRTPLASIRGYAELTRRGREEVGPDTRHALGRIESEASRMTLLVEDLLLLARLDAGRPLQFEETDLVPLVVDTVSDARAAGPGHRWRLELPDEPAVVTADAARLQQVLVNLLANARTHTPPGTTVTTAVRRSGPWLCVDVRDDGPGIPPALLPHVFERFARGDSSRSRASGSTGLGLAIVDAVATAHGGSVTVDSAPGRTVFTVHLPAAAHPLPPAFAPVTAAGAGTLPAPAPAGNGPGPHSQAGHSLTTWVEQGA